MRVDFSRLPEVVNPAYYRFMSDHRRYNVFYGGASSGKSHIVAQRYVYRWVTERGHNGLAVRKVEKSGRDSTFALLRQVISQWGLTDLFHTTVNPLAITCKHNGNTFLFRGLDDVEKLKSITFETGPLTDIWIEEASEITPDEDRQLRLRLRGVAPIPKQVVYTFNPISALHWLKGRFIDTPLPLDRCSVLKTTYHDNRWLSIEDREEIEALKDEDITYYQIYALGDWGIIGNVVFNNYVIEDFDIDYQDFDSVYQGQDYGFNHPFAFELAGFKDGELYVFDEIYKRNRTNTELIADSNDYFGRRDVLPLVKRKLTTGDSAEPDRIKEWNQAGYLVRASKKGKDSVRFGIDYLRRQKLHIHKNRCPGLAAEIPIFKHREDKDGNVLDDFVDFKNDGISALRYACEPLTGGMRWGPA
jgi:phage terminase large subunit